MSLLQSSVLIFISVFLSCNPNNKIKFVYFDLVVPNDWKIIPLTGTDSNIGYIITDGKDTLKYDEGYYSSSLTEKVKDFYLIREENRGEIDSNIDTSNVIFATGAKMDRDYYIKQNVTFEKINNYTHKFIFPRQEGQGITGLHIDSIAHDSSLGNFKFSIYGNNLNKATQLKVLDILHNLDYHPADAD